MVKAAIRRFLKIRGYEVLRGDRAYAAQKSIAGLLEQTHVNLVLDIGANTGQFAHDLRTAGYGGRIISFEPLASVYAKLKERADADPNWVVADRTAIGAKTGSISINVAGNTESSSILDMLPTHSEAAPHSRYVKTEIVPIHRLDDLCAPTAADRILLKIDVQGYEKQVIDGAALILKLSSAVICELSLLPLYDGQLLAREMWDLLVEAGFEPWSLEPCFRSQNGRTLQLDGVFVRAQPRTLPENQANARSNHRKPSA